MGIVPSHAPRITVSGVDLIRDEFGDFRVLEDNLPHPVGRVLRDRDTAERGCGRGSSLSTQRRRGS